MSYTISNIITKPPLPNTIDVNFQFNISVIVNHSTPCTESMAKQNVVNFMNTFCEDSTIPYVRYHYEDLDYDDIVTHAIYNSKLTAPTTNTNTSTTTTPTTNTNTSTTTTPTTNTSGNGNDNVTNMEDRVGVTNIRSSILYILTTDDDQLNYIKVKLQSFVS